MSKIKNITRPGWLVAGIIAALVLVPTTAVAVTTITIQGANGNLASVTHDGQLLTATTDPSAFVNSEDQFVTGEGNWTPIVAPPKGKALVVTWIHMDTDPPKLGGSFIFTIMTGATCTSNNQVGSYREGVTPASAGETAIPFNPGLAIPAGDALCVTADINELGGNFNVTGYAVSSVEVPAGPLHRVRALLRPATTSRQAR